MQAHGEASAGSAGHRPARLMQRLAQVGLTADAAEVDERPHRAGMNFFILGLLGGALVGGAVLSAVELLGTGQLRAVGQQSVAAFTAAMAPWSAVFVAEQSARAPSKPAPPPATAKQDQPDVFEVKIDRGARAHAAFGLRLVGAQEQSFQILMRDVPAGAVLSHGERRDASTWAVTPSDLEHLHLALDDGTPDAFDLRIDVLAWSGVTAGSSVARVRLVGPPGTAETPVPALERRRADAASAMAPGAAPDSQQQKAPVATPSRNRVRDDKGKTASAPPAAAAANERHWPEGASGLGAVTPSAERQIWWKLPPPSWSPFPNSTTNQP